MVYRNNCYRFIPIGGHIQWELRVNKWTIIVKFDHDFSFVVILNCHLCLDFVESKSNIKIDVGGTWLGILVCIDTFVCLNEDLLKATLTSHTKESIIVNEWMIALQSCYNFIRLRKSDKRTKILMIFLFLDRSLLRQTLQFEVNMALISPN